MQNTIKNQYALRQGDWVYLNTHKGSAVKEPADYLEHFSFTEFPQGTLGLLFNLKTDPRQTTNLYEKYPDKVQEMKKLLASYLSGKRCAPSRL